MILRDATIAAQVFQLAASFFGNTLILRSGMGWLLH